MEGYRCATCTKYYAALLQVERKRATGKNFDDRVRNTNSVYQRSNNGKSFDFNHVWPYLQQNVKWSAAISMSTTDTDTDANQSDHPDDASISLEKNDNPPSFQPLSSRRQRPMERNAAKKAKQRDGMQEALLEEMQKHTKVWESQQTMMLDFNARHEEID